MERQQKRRQRQDRRQQEKRAKRWYTPSEKEVILGYAAKVGLTGAARKYRVPLSTIDSWRRRSRTTTGPQVPSPGTGSTTPRRADAVRASKGRRFNPATRNDILKTAECDGVAAAARKHGCSPWSIYSWRRQQAGAPSATESAAALPPEQEDRHRLLLEIWRTNPGFGPTQVRNQLRRLGYKASVHTVRDVMTAHGYVQPRLRPKTPPRRFEVVRPRQLYHFDFVHFRVHKQPCCLLLIEDDFSRFVAASALLRSEHADGVISAFEVAITRYGRPESVMVDRGAAFYSWRGVARFEQFVAELDIDYYPVDEASKNGKLERLVATVRKELLSQVEFADLDDAQHRITAWVHLYNYRRTHMALGGLLVPADRFHGMAEDALRRIEAGDPSSPLEILAPTNRALEILRVVSVGGQPSVYLMGQKIFG